MTINLYSEIIKCLVNQPGIDVNAKGFGGKTPLHLAIELDELALVEMLLAKKRINPLAQDDEGKTSLDYAKGKSEILQTLIDRRYGSDQDSLLHLSAMMNEANAVRFLINNGVDVNSKNALLHTPLHLAAGAGHKDIVEILVKEGNAEIDVFDIRNKSPMDYAINSKKLEIVKLLLELGGNVNLARQGQGSMKLSPLHNAVSVSNYDERNLCLDIVRCLINAPNSKINLQDYEKKTPLHYADRLKTIETLLTREDIDPLIKDDNGKTPFCYAKEANRLDIIKALVSNKYGVNKNSLLHLAAKRGYVKLVEDILKEGIEVDILNDKDQSPIYLAAKHRHFNVVKLLLKKGADATNVFQQAIKANDVKLIKLLLREKGIVLFGRDNNFPTFHVLSNKYLEERRVADKKVKRCNNIICIATAICAIALAVTYPHIGIAVIIGVLALIIAIVMSNLTQKYIEEEFQKKMAVELESERGSESESRRASDTESKIGSESRRESDTESKGVLSDVEIQSTSSEEAELS